MLPKSVERGWHTTAPEELRRRKHLCSTYGACSGYEEIISLFMSCNYSVAKFGPPTRKAIVEAVEKPAGGADIAQAERINNKYDGRLSSSW